MKRYPEIVLAIFLSALFSVPALAWGPHPRITQAALASLGSNAALARILGPETSSLSRHCWCPDIWMQFTSDGYSDDFLLFPKRPAHLGTSHAFRMADGSMGAHSRELFEIYFRRALQALRTETPANAARWVGVLTHFTEDTGAPPHAIKESGPLHGPMEQWVDEKLISIDGCAPTVLGTDDESAFEGFWQRQERLNRFAIDFAGRVKPLVATGKRVEAEPLILECALESARAVADLYVTLGPLAGRGAAGARLSGVVSGAAVEGPLGRLPAKLMIEGSDYSTLADAGGRYEFRHLPSGTHRLLAIKPGNEVWRGEVVLPAEGATREIEMTAARIPGNMLRNPALDLHWANPSAPDLWCIRRGFWRTESIPVVAGSTYRLEVKWKSEKPGASVILRWSSFEHFEEGRHTNEVPLVYPRTVLVATAPPGTKFAHPVVDKASPDEVLSYVAFVAHKAEVSPAERGAVRAPGAP